MRRTSRISTSTPTRIGYRGSTRRILVVSVLVLLVTGGFVYNAIVGWVVETRQAVSGDVTARANAFVRQRTDDLLRLSGLSLGMAVRDDLIKKDVSQLNRYLYVLAREKNVIRAAVVDGQGRVIAATDPRMIDTNAADLVPPHALEGGDVAVLRGNGEETVAAPVMAFVGRIGTVLLFYRLEPFSGVSSGTDVKPQ